MTEELGSRIDKMRPDMDSFESNLHGYTKAEIQKDKNKLFKKESKYFSDSVEVRDLEIMSYGLESAVIFSADKYKWLGENARVIAPTVYDDTFEAADMIILEKEKEGGASTGMTFDLTTSINKDVVSVKISSSLDHLVWNKLSSPKYVLPNTPIEKQPKYPVGIFACSEKNALKIIESAYENKNQISQVQMDFRIFFGHQLKMFLNTAIEIVKTMKYAKNLEIRKNVDEVMAILQKDLKFIQDNITEDSVPTYLLEDPSYLKFKNALLSIKQELKEKYLPNDSNYTLKNSKINREEDASGDLKKKRPRIPGKV